MSDRMGDSAKIVEKKVYSASRFPGSTQWRASIHRSNGKFIPTILDDSTGFEDSKAVPLNLLTP